jgi:hypothetical protein
VKEAAYSSAAQPGIAAPAGATARDWFVSIAIGALVAVLTWFALRYALSPKKSVDDKSGAGASQPQADAASAPPRLE